MTTRYRMNRLRSHAANRSQKEAHSQRPCYAASHSHSPFDVARLFAGAFFFAVFSASAADTSLQIIQAGVERSEDAPFVSAGFRFLPGDFVFFQFQISGYASQTIGETEIRKISLTYHIEPQDTKGVPLTTPVDGAVKDELSSEDKNWTPKRRGSFLLPSFLAAGEYRLRFLVNDLIAKKSAEEVIPFHVGGVTLAPADGLNVQSFVFLRNEDDTQPLEVAAYQAGDTVYGRFIISGFQIEPGNKYQVSYGLSVTRPDGKIFLDQPAAAQLSDSSFYPAHFVPGNIGITTPKNAPHGQYVVLLTVRDLSNGATYQIKRAFTIE